MNWGFTNGRLTTTADRQILLGLYTRVIRDFNVKPRQLEQWRLSGTLVQGIRGVYEDKDDKYYRWFLAHEDILAAPQQFTLNDSRPLEDLFRAGWIYQGKPSSASNGRLRPIPCTSLWICTASNLSEEQIIYNVYQSLFLKASFDEVFEAYRDHLSHSGIREHLFADALKTPLDDPTPVWKLKRLLSPMYNRAPCVMVQYLFGFTNCRSSEEAMSLLLLYARYFSLGDRIDPLELNEAAMRNRLFDYLTVDVGVVFDYGENPVMYARLLKRSD
ncbi:hypothetical protein BC629DRAFT_1461997 [Irpex lacteus]|nr:hypothetical protein BC629DRAFT_1461997 [Irpex lacteus]